MSKAIKGVKKAVKKVAKGISKAVKKYWKYVAIGVAAYFTAGVALSYFGATSSFAAGLPGFGGSGVFTKAATAMGFSGPANAAAGVAAQSANAMAATMTKATPGFMGGGGGQAAATTPGFTAGKGGKIAAGTVTSGGGGGGDATGKGVTEVIKDSSKKVASGWSDMSVADKLLVAKTVSDVGAAVFAKDHKPHRNYWGVNRKGEGEPMVPDDPFGDMKRPEFLEGRDAGPQVAQAPPPQPQQPPAGQPRTQQATPQGQQPLSGKPQFMEPSDPQGGQYG